MRTCENVKCTIQTRVLQHGLNDFARRRMSRVAQERLPYDKLGEAHQAEDVTQ